MKLAILLRELDELARRRPTYIMRMAYVVAAGIVFYLLFATLDLSADYIGLGYGEDLFYHLLAVQLGGICLFMPLLMGPAIAGEKDRRTLNLLAILPMKNRELLFQKLIGRSIPMLTLLVAGFPFIGIAYTMGGLERGTIFEGMVFLLVECLAIGCFVLMISTLCKNTFRAICWSLACLLAWLSIFIPVVVLNVQTESILLHCIHGLIDAIVFFFIANTFFRDTTTPLPPALNDWDFDRSPEERSRPARPLPDLEPIYWREAGQMKVSTKVKTFTTLMFPVIGLCAVGMLVAFDGRAMVLAAFIAAGGLILIAAQAIISFTSERENQTLETLLTTSLEREKIYEQKVRAISKFDRVIYTLFYIVAISALIIGLSAFDIAGSTYGFVLLFAMAYPLFLNLARAVGTLIALKADTRSRAFTTNMIFQTAAIFVPILFYARWGNTTGMYLALFHVGLIVVALTLVRRHIKENLDALLNPNGSNGRGHARTQATGLHPPPLSAGCPDA